MPDGMENCTIAKGQERLWAVADALGAAPSTSVEHDRGAASTRAMAAGRPDRAKSHVALSVGHPTAPTASRSSCRGALLRLQLPDAEEWLRGKAAGAGALHY